MNSPAQIRARAARIVRQVGEGSSLDGLLQSSEGATQERGLLRSLCFGTIRWQLRIDAVLKRLLSRPQAEVHPDVRALLRVGLFQLLHTDIAAHAAVAETVEAVRHLKQPRAAGLVNAVLRRCQRDGAALCAAVDRDLASRTAHPVWLVDALRADWPDYYLDILDANNGHPPMWLRINTQRSSVDDYAGRLLAAGLQSDSSPFAPDALRLHTPTDVRSLPGFDDGEVSVQDAAAQLAARLLSPRAGERILDACAAPGGKTCHLLELQPTIELLALDVSSERLRKVHENLKRLQLAAQVQSGDAAEPGSWWDGRPFDRILLDVPCSATGVIRRHPDIKLLRRESDIAELAQRQRAMLQALWPTLKAGGRLLYASCSALRAETSSVIAEFLSATGDAVDVTAAAALDAGAPPAMREPGLAVYAGEAQMDGFYYACLVKRPA